MAKSKSAAKKLPAEARDTLLETLRTRFEKNMHRHKGLKWDTVRERLDKKPAKLWSLGEMEETGGEPDVVAHDRKSGEITFYDCSPESPKGRRSICYDDQALQDRKEHKPRDSAENMADEMGITILTEEEYRGLQAVGPVDTKTSSWLKTPSPIRKLGGAIFGDYRFGTVFVYHNGAESYYAARGFRGKLTV